MAKLWRRGVLGLAVSLWCAGTGTAAVEVLGLAVDRGRDVEASGLVSYHQTVLVQVRLEAIANLDCVQITDPAGRVCVVTGSCAFSDQADAQAGLVRYVFRWDDDRTGAFGFRETFMAAPPPAGAYHVYLESLEGYPVEVSTPAASAVPTSGPVLQEPAADAVIDSTVPTFAWTNWTGADNRLQVREEGNPAFTDDAADDRAQLWLASTATRTSAAYNFDGSATRAALLPGRSYLWQLSSTRVDRRSESPPVTLTTTQLARRRFSVYAPGPALPDLPGQLACGSVLWGDWAAYSDAIRSYSPDLRGQTWLAPESSYDPAWAQDGSVLVYVRNGIGLWRDRRDGSGPVRIPAPAYAEPTLSPDAQRVAYTSVDLASGACQIRIATVAGTQDAVLLETASFGEYLRRPAWAPDGLWIAYGKRDPYGVTSELRLIHPDGTADRAIVPTGVRGYAGYDVTWLDAPSWSPDALKLAVEFAAEAAGGSGLISGIGVIPRDGGLLTPAFLSPPDLVCCPVPNSPTWSPRGTRLVFSSGHHLPFDPEWAAGKFEHGVELWMVRPDGVGDPVRLTYNASYDAKVSWWAPLVFADVPPGTWAFNAISTCCEAGIVHGYWDGYHPADAVDRAQMAGYIARVLTGGAVPDPPEGTQTFPDVDSEHWAYAFIEYCSAAKIVSGYWDGYHPEYVVDRAQMAGFIARAMVPYEERPTLTNYTAPSTPSFADVDTDFWTYKYIEFCKSRGVVSGYWDGQYHPEFAVTRDQMAMYVARAFGLPM